MSRFRQPLLMAVPLLAALLWNSPPATAGDEVEVKKIKVKKLVHDCEGEDCDHQERFHRVIVVGEDGEVEEIEGGRRVWVGLGDSPELVLQNRGKGGFLGVATSELTPELRRHFGVPEEAGVLIAKVVDDSAAALAGVEVGDILTAVDGEAVASSADLIRAIGRSEPGSPVELQLWRDGEALGLGATLGERPRHHRQARVLHCDEGDCPQIASIEELDCGGETVCNVEVQCRDGECECVVNGEAADCESVPGFVTPGG